MEQLLQRSKHSIFHNIFKYVVFQRHERELLWSKGLSLWALALRLLKFHMLNSTDDGILTVPKS